MSLLANRKDFISDLLENLDIRGFEPSKNPAPSVANMKTSWKFNVYNYPLLGSIRVIPFLYGQIGVSMLKNSEKMKNLRDVKE